MSFMMSTTGIQNPIVFADLGARSYEHPTTNYDLETDFSEEEIKNSLDIQLAIDNNWITVVDEKGDPITSLITEDEYSVTREIIAWGLIINH